jgi:hypothetical protein
MDRDAAVAEMLAAKFAGVGDRQLIFGHDERDREAGLQIGLVPTGEGPASVGRLELRRGDGLLLTLVVGERAAVEPSQLVVQDPPEPRVEPCYAGVTEL